MKLHSIFASRKRDSIEEEKQVQMPTVLPSNFQVYAKIDEESRKDNFLAISFLLTLNDVKGSVTYEFRGVCTIAGSSADFEAVMEAHKDSRIPKILDLIYQRVYPVVFMLAGMTTSSYPQSIALLTEMVSTEPIQVHQEAEPVEKPEPAKQIAEKAVEKPSAEAKLSAEAESAKPAESPKPASKVKKPQVSAEETTKATIAK